MDSTDRHGETGTAGHTPGCCTDDMIDDCAQKLKVCGHPMRLRLLCRIVMDEHPCVSDLWSCLDQPQPVISQHLAVLKQKGIVASEVQGNRRVYRIVDPLIHQIIRSLQVASAVESEPVHV